MDSKPRDTGSIFSGSAIAGHPGVRQGLRTVAEARPPVSDAREQMTNSKFATRSTARGARTIMARRCCAPHGWPVLHGGDMGKGGAVAPRTGEGLPHACGRSGAVALGAAAAAS